jgi:hypothetical protein
MDILVFPDRTVEWNGERFACALGPAGVTEAKREGDGATPAVPSWFSAVPLPRHGPYATAALIAERGPTQHALDTRGSALDKHGQAQAANLAAANRHAPEQPGLDTLL